MSGGYKAYERASDYAKIASESGRDTIPNMIEKYKLEIQRAYEDGYRTGWSDLQRLSAAVIEVATKHEADKKLF